MDKKELIEQIVGVNYHAFESAILASGKSETSVAEEILALCANHFEEVAVEAYKSERMKSKTHVNMYSEDERVEQAISAAFKKDKK